MKLNSLESASAVLDNATYYSIGLWDSLDRMGYSYPNAYKTEHGALRMAKKLFTTGLYACVTVRKTEVVRRDPQTEISTSGCVYCFKLAPTDVRASRYSDDMIVGKVPQAVRKRTQQNMDMHGMDLYDAFSEAVRAKGKSADLRNAWYFSDYRKYIPSAYVS